MQISEPMILQRLAELENQQARLMSDLDATAGAIQDCRFWLETIRQPDGESKTEAPSG